MRDPTYARIREFVKRGLRSRTVDSTMWLGSSSAVNGILGALSSAILARFLGVADYGIYVLIISLLGLMTDVADLGVSSSIVRFGSVSVAENNEERFRTIVSIVARWKLLFAGILLLFAFVFLNDIVGYVFRHVDERISFYFRLSLLACMVGIAAGIFTPIYQSFKNFRTLSVLLSIRGAARMMVVVVLVYGIARCTVENLIWLEIGVLVAFLCLMYLYSPFKRFSLRLHNALLAREMWSFNKWISLYQAIALIGGRLDLAFVGGLSDAHALGLYGSALKVSGLLNVVSSSYMSVLLSEMSASLSRDELRRKRRHSFVVVAMIVGAILIVALLATPIVRLLFGAGFLEAAPVLQILCVGLIFAVLSYPLTASLFALNKSIAFPLTSILSTATLILGNLYLIPRFGVNGAAMAFVAGGIVTFLCSLCFFFLLNRNGLQEQE